MSDFKLVDYHCHKSVKMKMAYGRLHLHILYHSTFKNK